MVGMIRSTELLQHELLVKKLEVLIRPAGPMEPPYSEGEVLLCQDGRRFLVTSVARCRLSGLQARHLIRWGMKTELCKEGPFASHWWHYTTLPGLEHLGKDTETRSSFQQAVALIPQVWDYYYGEKYPAEANPSIWIIYIEEENHE